MIAMLAFTILWYFHNLSEKKSMKLINEINKEVHQQKIINLSKKHELQYINARLDGEEKERTRIAKELHDSVNQQLTLIKKQTQKLELDTISGMVNNTLEEVRSISRNLYPSILKQLGLAESIEQLLLDVDEQTELFITTDIENIDSFFDDKQALNLYRIIQEICQHCVRSNWFSCMYVIVLRNLSWLESKIC